MALTQFSRILGFSALKVMVLTRPTFRSVNVNFNGSWKEKCMRHVLLLFILGSIPINKKKISKQMKKLGIILDVCGIPYVEKQLTVNSEEINPGDNLLQWKQSLNIENYRRWRYCEKRNLLNAKHATRN